MTPDQKKARNRRRNLRSKAARAVFPTPPLRPVHLNAKMRKRLREATRIAFPTQRARVVFFASVARIMSSTSHRKRGHNFRAITTGVRDAMIVHAAAVKP